MPGFDGSRIKVSALFIDRDGGLWVGTDSDGILRIYKDKVDRFGNADGLSSDAVNGFYQDREGDLWVVTTKGIDRFRDMPVATFSRREGPDLRGGPVCPRSHTTEQYGLRTCKPSISGGKVNYPRYPQERDCQGVSSRLYFKIIPTACG